MRKWLLALIFSVLLGLRMEAQSPEFSPEAKALAADGVNNPDKSRLAFKYVAKMLMLAEVNAVGEKLNLPMRLPVNDWDLRKIMVDTTMNNYSVVGFLETEKYHFSYSSQEGVYAIKNLKSLEEFRAMRKGPAVIKQKSLMDTNDAYRIATNWLVQMSVRVSDLETNDPYLTKFFGSNIPPTLPLFSVQADEGALPLFEVVWHSVNGPRATIAIDGRTKELFLLELLDDSVCHRPASQIKDLEQLLRISNEEFLGYSEDQRKNLLARFSAIPPH